MFRITVYAVSCLAYVLFAAVSAADNYYIDADGGNDINSGTSPSEAWATLAQASSVSFQAGDQILLQRGDTFYGKLELDEISGTESLPVQVGAYGTGADPVIDAAGYLAGGDESWSRCTSLV